MKFEGRDRAFSSALGEGERVVNASAAHMQSHATRIEDPITISQSGWTMMLVTWLVPIVVGGALARIAAMTIPDQMVAWSILAGAHLFGSLVAGVKFVRGDFTFSLRIDDEKVIVGKGGKVSVIPWADLRKTELIEKTRKTDRHEVTFYILRLVKADKTTLDVSLDFSKGVLKKVDEAFEAKGFDVTDCVKTTAQRNIAATWVPAGFGLLLYCSMCAFLTGAFLAM